MRWGVIICAGLMSCSPALPQQLNPAPIRPNQFEIGRHTFFDFGPPFGFYEVFIVRPEADGASVEKVILTPPGNACIAPATVETASASIANPPSALLGSTNPCAIPENALRRERKRCKNCLTFSGANVVMQVRCGEQTRLIRSDVLDRDMLDGTANTPEYTSWTMRLLERLDQAVGHKVVDKPMLAVPEREVRAAEDTHPAVLRDLSIGKYDALFQGAPHKASDLYRAAQNRPPPPSVRLLSSTSISPEVFVEPEYPPLAKLVGLEGVVSFTVEIDSSGAATDLTFESGHPMLREAVRKVVSNWKFPPSASGQRIQATIGFALNCRGRTE